MPRGRWWCVLLALALHTSACEPSIAGEAGRIALVVEDEAEGATLTTAIAEGGIVSVRAETLRDGTVRAITAMTATPPRVTLEAPPGAPATLRALAAGATTVDVVVEGGAHDRFELRVRPVVRIALAHTCVGGEPGVYLTDSALRLPVRRLDARGHTLLGRTDVALEIVPAGAVAVDASSSSAFLALRSAANEGRVRIDGPQLTDPLEFELIDEARLEHVELLGGELHHATRVGETTLALLVPTYDGRRLCQGEPARVLRTLSPATCEVSEVMPAVRDAPRRGAISLRGLAPGVCRFAVHYPKARAGAERERIFEVPIL